MPNSDPPSFKKDGEGHTMNCSPPSVVPQLALGMIFIMIAIAATGGLCAKRGRKAPAVGSKTKASSTRGKNKGKKPAANNPDLSSAFNDAVYASAGGESGLPVSEGGSDSNTALGGGTASITLTSSDDLSSDEDEDAIPAMWRTTTPQFGPLPPGWAEEWDSGTSRTFYVNHGANLTSWEDPRFPPPLGQVQAIIDYKGNPGDGELKFQTGAVIRIYAMDDDATWRGELLVGPNNNVRTWRTGTFPSTLVEPMENFNPTTTAAKRLSLVSSASLLSGISLPPYPGSPLTSPRVPGDAASIAMPSGPSSSSGTTSMPPPAPPGTSPPLGSTRAAMMSPVLTSPNTIPGLAPSAGFDGALFAALERQSGVMNKDVALAESNALGPLPAGWQAVWDEGARRVIWHNTENGLTTWKDPRGLREPPKSALGRVIAVAPYIGGPGELTFDDGAVIRVFDTSDSDYWVGHLDLGDESTGDEVMGSFPSTLVEGIEGFDPSMDLRRLSQSDLAAFDPRNSTSPISHGGSDLQSPPPSFVDLPPPTYESVVTAIEAEKKRHNGKRKSRGRGKTRSGRRRKRSVATGAKSAPPGVSRPGTPGLSSPSSSSGLALPSAAPGKKGSRRGSKRRGSSGGRRRSSSGGKKRSRSRSKGLESGDDVSPSPGVVSVPSSASASSVVTPMSSLTPGASYTSSPTFSDTPNPDAQI